MSEEQQGSRRRGRPPRSLAAKLPVDTADLAREVRTEGLMGAVEAPERPSMRPNMRPTFSRDEAARRANEIRGHLGDMEQNVDKFYIDPKTWPEGWTVEWKTKSIFGQENPAYMTNLHRTGWEPVPTGLYPDMMPGNGNHPVIERDGMLLMMRPAEITEEVRSIERGRARDQVRAKEEQLAGTPEGGLGHRDHIQAKPKINKSYEAIPIPKE
jgi:hypothetical protein